MNQAERASFDLIEKTEKGIKRNRIGTIIMIVLHTLIFAYLFSLQFKFILLYQDSPSIAVLNLSLISPLVIFLAAALTFQIIRLKRDWNGKPEHIAILSLQRRLERIEGQNQSAQVNPFNQPENSRTT